MTQQHIEQRVDELSRGQETLRLDVSTLKRDVAHQATQLNDIGAGVKALLEADARRPKPVSIVVVLSTVLACVSIVGSLGFFSSWFIASSPTVVDLEKRVNKLDDKEVGRVTRLERDASWVPRIFLEKK